MKPAKKFLTKTGFCHILEDKIVFTPRGFVGIMGDLTVEGRMMRILLFFGLLTILIIYFAYVKYLENEIVWAGLFGIIGAYLIYGIIKGLNTSLHPIIDRSQIKEVKFIKAVKDLTSPSFEIKFFDVKGKTRKRIITLPYPSEKYKSNIHNAINIMREEGLLD